MISNLLFRNDRQLDVRSIDITLSLQDYYAESVFNN